MHLNIHSIKVYNYNVNAGFPANDYNQATSFVSSTGITFWGAAPYIMANHQDPITDTLQSKVYIKSMNIMDQDLPFMKNSDVSESLRKEDTILVGTKPYTKKVNHTNAAVAHIIRTSSIVLASFFSMETF